MKRLRILGFAGLVALGCSCASIPPIPVRDILIVAASSNLDGVSLCWTVGEEPTEPYPGILSSVFSFSVERETNGSGKWEQIADRLSPSTESFIDKEINPLTRYRYRVAAHGRDPRSPTDMLLSGEGGSAETSTPVETSKLWELHFSNPVWPLNGPVAMVSVRIEKFEKGVGKVEISQLQFEGDRIGWWAEQPVEGDVSQHSVSMGNGHAIKADFDIGVTLIFVSQRPIQLATDVWRCNFVYDAKRNHIACRQVAEVGRFETYPMIYKDADGDHPVYAPQPRPLYLICPRHRRLGVPGKVAEARELIKEADRLWDSDSEAAIAIYKRLQAEYRYSSD